MKSKLRNILFVLLAIIVSHQPIKAERPSAPKLLPYNTIVYLRIDDFPALAEDFQRTSLGRIRHDESVAPFVDRLYNEFINAFPQIEDELGVSIEELLKLPTGEVSISIAVTDTGRPMFAFIADVGDNVDTATALIERAEFEHINNGGDLTQETIGETEVTLFTRPGPDDDIYSFIKDQTVVLSSSELMTTHLINVWEGTATEVDRTLADNRKFTDIMRNSTGTDGFEPQISFYADPLTLINATNQDNLQAQTVLAVLPTLGVDGFKAVGGSIIIAPPGFDTMAHFHLSLGSPRRGVLNLLTFGEGDMTPEEWVSNEVMNYNTIYWDLEKSYAELSKVVDSILGTGYFEKMVEDNINTPAGINLQEDVIAHFGGRVTMIQQVVEPGKLNGNSMGLGIKLKEADVFGEFLTKLIAEEAPELEKKSRNGIAYWQPPFFRPRPVEPVKVQGALDPPNGQGARPIQPDPRAEFERNFRVPSPTFAIIGDTFVVADSETIVFNAIDTYQGDGERLADADDFKLVADAVRAQTGEIQPSALSFTRPEQGMKFLYDLILSDRVQSTLEREAERGDIPRILNSAFKDNPLPPFEQLSKYFAPAGGVLFNRPTGLHYLSFSLNPENQ